MSSITKKQMAEVTEEVAAYYLKSRDFNGLPVVSVREKYPLTKTDMKKLIESGTVEAHFGFGHPNPHVKALALGDMAAQLKMLAEVSEEDLTGSVLYPTKQYLANAVDPANYHDRPFSLLMALGEPSLEYQCFEPQILKLYRDDPRYYYDFSGVAGRLYIDSPQYEDESFPEKNKVFMDCFGAGFSKNYEKDAKTCIVAFPYHLHRLPPEQQLLWKHRQLDKNMYWPERGFVVSQVMGSWDFDATMYEAFVAELQTINKMAVKMEGAKLFKKEFADSSEPPPRNFHRLLIPTKREYYEFVESLDKMMSDNINRQFFAQRMPDSAADTQVGTITLLEEYFSPVQAPDRKPIIDMLKAFREVRGQRSKSSHHQVSDEYADSYNHKQRDIMRQAYTAIRLIRLAFTNHPAAKGVKVPDWLFKGDISPE